MHAKKCTCTKILAMISKISPHIYVHAGPCTGNVEYLVAILGYANCPLNLACQEAFKTPFIHQNPQSSSNIVPTPHSSPKKKTLWLT